MNQQQRTFLINKIDKQADTAIRALRDSKPEYPNLSNYLMKAVLTDTLQLQPNEYILKIIKERALKASDRYDWLEGERRSGSLEKVVKMRVGDFFILPVEYTEAVDEYRRKVEVVDKEVEDIIVKRDSLTTRIQLASDKVLQTMINEVDDMGDISLMDTTLRLLNSGNGSEKLIGNK